MMPTPKFLQDHWKRLTEPLIGGKIVEAFLAQEMDEHFPVIVVEKGRQRFAVTILRDAEGNGPGSVHIDKLP